MMTRTLPLALLTLTMACTRPGGEPARNDDPSWEALPALDAEITDRMRRDAVAGLSACAVKDGELVWCAGYGEADTQTGRPALATTPFLLASVSKAVAGLAVMQAVEDGALDLDQPVNEVLPFTVTHPDSPNRDITLRALMTHTAGIEDNWDILEPHYVDGDSPLALGDFLEGYLVQGGADFDSFENFTPEGVGGAHVYSNVGAALGAYMVEAGTGEPFDDFCDRRLFEPLGLNAGWHLADFNVEELAVPTQLAGGQWSPLEHYGFPDYPDGQLRADAVSVAKLVALVTEGGTLEGQTLLSEASVAELRRDQVPDLEEGQGLFWYRWPLEGEDVFGHNGGELGTSTEMFFRESDGVGVVVLMNSEGRGGTLAAVELAVLEAVEAL